MADPNEAGRNARAVYFVDTAGNPLIPVTAPTAAVLADATVNPTTSLLGALDHGYNGTTWDRLRTKGTGWQGVAPVRSSDGAELFLLSSDADGIARGTKLVESVQTWALNGAGTWDAIRNNAEATLLASAARTTTQTSADIVVHNARTLTVVLDMTTVGTGSVTVTINGKDAASGKYYPMLTGAAIITNSTNRYRIGPTLAAVANSIAQDYLPRIIQIVVTANNANSATYSVGYVLGV